MSFWVICCNRRRSKCQEFRFLPVSMGLKDDSFITDPKSKTVTQNILERKSRFRSQPDPDNVLLSVNVSTDILEDTAPEKNDS